MLYLWVVSLAFAKGSVCIMLLNIFGHDRTFKLISKSDHSVELEIASYASQCVQQYFLRQSGP